MDGGGSSEDGVEWLLEDGSLPAPQWLLLLLVLVLRWMAGFRK